MIPDNILNYTSHPSIRTAAEMFLCRLFAVLLSKIQNFQGMLTGPEQLQLSFIWIVSALCSHFPLFQDCAGNPGGFSCPSLYQILKHAQTLILLKSATVVAFLFTFRQNRMEASGKLWYKSFICAGALVGMLW